MSSRSTAQKMTTNIMREMLNIIKDHVITRLPDLYDSPIVGSREERRRMAYYLKSKDYFRTNENNAFELSDKGIRKLERLSLTQLVLPGAWDGVWRLVIFDIPQIRHEARAEIRRLLRELGFQLVQQSVWAHPAPCLEPFKLIRETYGIRDDIVLIETKNSELDTRLVPIFKKTLSNF